MHDNGKNSGLVRSSALTALGNILIVLKKAVSVKDSAWKRSAVRRETDHMGEMWENVDLMRRRMTI